MHVLSIVGARPQFIKAAVICREAAARGVEHTLVHTGQHYDANMSDVFFDELEIPRPQHHLGVGSGRHGEMTGRMLAAIEPVMIDAKPDWVLVYGDTNSTIAGALAAAKLHLPIAHVEAGLRSFNRRMPEEINRVLTDHCSDLLLTPTQVAVDNLKREGVDERRIRQVGDVMFDVALFYAGKAEEKSDVLSRLLLEPDGYVLATVHRAENTDDAARLGAILAALEHVARDTPVVLPLHPRTRQKLKEMGWPVEGFASGPSPLRGRLGGGDEAAGSSTALEPSKENAAGHHPPPTPPSREGGSIDAIRTIDPVGYLDMVMLEKHARLIVTDSGGVQKEAFFHRTPCITLRDETEWVELVEGGYNRLVPPTDADAVTVALTDALATMRRHEVDDRLYGDGRAAQRIMDCLATR